MYRNCGMRKRNSISVFLALCLFLSGWLNSLTGLSSVRADDVDTEATPAYNATVYVYGIGEYLNVRNVAGTTKSYVIDQIFRGTRVYINKYETVAGDPSGCEKWCEVIYKTRGQTVRGHVIADYLVPDVSCSQEFEEEIADFPDSYKPYLRLLHSKFPNWKFEAVKASADWNTIMKVETELGTSAIPNWVPDTWKSHEPGAYDPKTGKYHEVDSGGWVNAAYDVVAYYLDPRNMLFDSQVFQFLDLGYDPKIQTKEAVKSIIGNTFMNQWDVYREPTPTPVPVPAELPEVPIEDKVPQVSPPPQPDDTRDDKHRTQGHGFFEDPSAPTPTDTPTPTPSPSPKPTSTPSPTPTPDPLIPVPHWQALMEAAEQSGISPVYLASKIIQEVGKEGSDSIFGTGHNGLYPGYYNYYNIGAYAADGYDAMGRGLWYASCSDGENERYMRPWNTGYKAIVGGAIWQRLNYYDIGQNSLFLMKFNVTPEDPAQVGLHQYMTNVRALENESYKMYQAYGNINKFSKDLLFKIPVFDGMPAEAAHLPPTIGPAQYIRDIYKSILGVHIQDSVVRSWSNKIMSDNMNAYTLAYELAYHPRVLFKKLDDKDYITFIYKGLMEDEVPKNVVDGYLKKFEEGMTRSEYVEELLNSSVFNLRLKKYGIVRKTFKCTDAQKHYDNDALFIDRLYSTALGRETEYGGFEFWVKKVRNEGTSYSALVEFFALSEEAKATYKTNSSYINMLYKAIYDRDADEGGFEYWMAYMDFGMNRQEVLEGFLGGQEFANLCKRYGGKKGSYKAGKASGVDKYLNVVGVSHFVKRMYEVVLDRECETKGYCYWGNQICTHKLTGADMAWKFVFSTEYLEKKSTDEEYVTMLYKSIMGRDPEEGGMKYWLDAMKHGASREHILNEFVKSQEYADICAKYGIDV